MTLETGQNVLLNVEVELRQELEPAQTLLLKTEELTVKERNLKPKNATLSVVLDQVCSLINRNITTNLIGYDSNAFSDCMRNNKFFPNL